MKQFLLCLTMLICSIFMYVLITVLEETNTSHPGTIKEEGNIADYGVYQN